MARKKKVKRPKMVRVVWLDAQAVVSLYGTLDDVLKQAKLAMRESSGWLLRYDDEVTVICRDYDAPDPDEPTAPARYGDVQTMPSGWVLGVYEGKREVKREQRTTEKDTEGEGGGTGGAGKEPGARPAPAYTIAPAEWTASSPTG